MLLNLLTLVASASAAVTTFNCSQVETFLRQMDVNGDGVIANTELYTVARNCSSLASHLELHSSIPRSQRVKWILEVCLGLSHIHQLRIIHGDLKSDNVEEYDTIPKPGVTEPCSLLSATESLFCFKIEIFRAEAAKLAMGGLQFLMAQCSTARRAGWRRSIRKDFAVKRWNDAGRGAATEQIRVTFPQLLDNDSALIAAVPGFFGSESTRLRSLLPARVLLFLEDVDFVVFFSPVLADAELGATEMPK
ncbi:hypothetical protein HDU83_009096 [Entophlyctis luteolus]|nr:hypothetical protein HDU83_009096 [Entophlyctis luteolus]